MRYTPDTPEPPAEQSFESVVSSMAPALTVVHKSDPGLLRLSRVHSSGRTVQVDVELSGGPTAPSAPTIRNHRSEGPHRPDRDHSPEVIAHGLSFISNRVRPRSTMPRRTEISLTHLGDEVVHVDGLGITGVQYRAESDDGFSATVTVILLPDTVVTIARSIGDELPQLRVAPPSVPSTPHEQ